MAQSTDWWDNLPGATPLNLASTSTVPNMATLPQGSSGSSLASGSDIPWGKILGTGATLGTSLAAGSGGSIAGNVSQIQGNATQQLQQGKDLVGQGQEALNPVLKYFKDLMSGNPQDALAATMPERRRIIDQYDAARKSDAQFTPRGGGQASAQSESRSREASDLATTTSAARKDASTALAAIGTNQIGQGLTAEQQAQQQLAETLSPLFQQNQSDTANTIKTYAGLAAMVAAFL